MFQSVTPSDDLTRILALPRREPEDLVALAAELTLCLRVPGSTETLRPLQALALRDIGTLGGACVFLDVGIGKTLISLLAPFVLDLPWAMMVLPANLIEKTRLDIERYAKDWHVCRSILLVSYQMLGRIQAAGELDRLAPPCIIFDEAHYLKNEDATVTRRVAKRLARAPETRVVVMTGSQMRTSLYDWAHLAVWALGKSAPIPLNQNELYEWASALDERVGVNELERYEVGALTALASPEDLATHEDRKAVRRGFQKHIANTPGVVTMGSTEIVAEHYTIAINALRYDVSEVTKAHTARLRGDFVTPDDWDITPVDVWRHSRELAVGYHGVWDPRPPADWASARKRWFQFVRHVLAHSSWLDSPEEVMAASLRGDLSREHLDPWLRIKDTFIPHTKAVWHDDTALQLAATWMAVTPGIVWVEHVPFGTRLAELTGATYYRQKGRSESGAFIDHDPGTRSIIVSVKANKEGRNLQDKWNRNLITAPRDGADEWNQMLGRTARSGQLRPITVDVFLGCREHHTAWQRALSAARTIRDTVGAPSRLLMATRHGFDTND